MIRQSDSVKAAFHNAGPRSHGWRSPLSEVITFIEHHCH